MVNQATIIELLEDNYPIKVQQVEAVSRGYTNQCYLIQADSDYILRISWSGKPIDQVKNEEKLLSIINKGYVKLPVPHLVATSQGDKRGEFHINNRRRIAHLYHKLPGEVKYQWCEKCEDQELFDILTLLNDLHKSIEHIKEPCRDPILFLKEKLNMIEQGNMDLQKNLSNVGITDLTTFLNKARKIICHADKLFSDAKILQWIHADLQLENILFENNRISGIVDFDNVKYSLKELDLIFALFSICRFSRSDKKFQYDKTQLLKGLKFYKTLTGDTQTLLLDKQYLNIWLAIFCLDQSLMHLLCAQNNVWELIPEIGFMASFKEVLNYV